MKIIITVYSILCFLCLISGAKLPSTYHRCRVTQSVDTKSHKCMEEAIQHAISYLSINGDDSLNLPDMDPLKINEIAIRQGGGGSITLEMIYKNINVFGFSSYKVKSVRGKLSSPKDFMLNIDGVIDKLNMVGQYSMDGRILIIPVTGNGPCNLTLEGVRAGCIITGESVTKHGKEYLKIKTFKLNLLLNRANLYFGNLFNDQRLSSGMNTFMNQNWNEIYSELRPYIEEATGKLFEKYAKRVLERIPYKSIFVIE